MLLILVLLKYSLHVYRNVASSSMMCGFNIQHFKHREVLSFSSVLHYLPKLSQPHPS